MATGRSNQLTKQTGEYLVAAELCRRGLIATTFTGGVPHFDILASDSEGRAFAVQVKAIRGGDWQLDARNYLDITHEGKRQVPGQARPEPHPGLICVFVLLADKQRADEFFILTWRDLRDLIFQGYCSYLKKHTGVRPRNPTSCHTAVSRKVLEPYRDKWSSIALNVGGAV